MKSIFNRGIIRRRTRDLSKFYVRQISPGWYAYWNGYRSNRGLLETINRARALQILRERSNAEFYWQ